MKMILRFLFIVSVIQGSIALLTKTSPFAQGDQEDVVKVVEPDIVAELPETHNAIALAAKAERHKHDKLPFAEEDNEEIVKVVEPDIVTDLSDRRSSIALASKANSKSQAKFPVVQEDKEEIVKVVEPDIVADLNDKHMPVALATQTNRRYHAKIPSEEEDPDVVRVAEADVVSEDDSDRKAMPTKSLVQHAAKVVDSDGSGSDSEEEAVRTVEADVVQDAGAKVKADANDDEKMDAKIEFKDKEDEDVVLTVDFNKEQVDDAKGKVAKAKVANVTAAVVHGEISNLTVHPTTKKLNVLTVKRRLRSPFVDNNEGEYVDPSQVVPALGKEEEYVDVKKVAPMQSIPTSGTIEVTPDIVEPEPKPKDRTPQIVYEEEPAQNEKDQLELSAVNDHEDIGELPAKPTAPQKHRKDCDEGSEYNENNC